MCTVSQSGSGPKQLIRQILGDDSVFCLFPSPQRRGHICTRGTSSTRERRPADDGETPSSLTDASKRERERTREMSTAVASAPAIGIRNGNLMHGQRLSHRTWRVAVGARHGRAAPRTMAFVPNLIPNPFHRWGACVVPTLSSEPRGRAPPSPASISFVAIPFLAPKPRKSAPNNTLI